ncbi:MAG: glycosyltransferase [Pseudomonadota bacterium]|nr:glycosyltransferase [Gammaproteobacteria bacterium]MBU1629155.1 glycosyltransferase [Gammaproteobacteria bacterium]MBU1927019.1 glycosyltransferase [Gammaproteobacteria bacterium]MBU2546215.1 glycosyltransferase [Gammaproteobacteria bacterium]
MKILHVISNLAPRYGGPTKACPEMAQAVAACGHEVVIYTTNWDGKKVLDVPLNKPIKQGNVSIYYFQIQHPKFFGFSLPLWRAVKNTITQFDVVHLHSLYFFHDWLVSHYCCRFCIPYVLIAHGALDPYLYRRHRFRKFIVEKLFQNRVTKHAAGIHCTTEDEATLAAPYLFNRPTYIVPLGLHLEEYQNFPDRNVFLNQYPQCKDRFVLLFFGRINFKKGLDILIDALSLITRRFQNVHLLLIGPDDDNYLSQVYRWIEEQGVSSYVTYVQFLKGVDKLTVLRHSDLFVLPSYTENFGIAVIEALACKLPVAISDKVNLCHAVNEANAGIVTSCDAKIFANCIMKVMDNPKELRTMAKNGRNLVESQFAWPKIAHRLIAMYEAVRHQ